MWRALTLNPLPEGVWNKSRAGWWERGDGERVGVTFWVVSRVIGGKLDGPHTDRLSQVTADRSG